MRPHADYFHCFDFSHNLIYPLRTLLDLLNRVYYNISYKALSTLRDIMISFNLVTPQEMKKKIADSEDIR